MPLITDQALCVRVWDWSETSQTVSLFARDLGLLRVVAKGSKRENARFSGGIEIGTRGEMIVSVKPTDGLHVLASWDVQETFPHLRSCLDAFYVGMFVLDVIPHALQDRDPHPRLFDAALIALRSLESGPLAETLAAFIWTTLVETGHQPDWFRDARTGDPIAPSTSYVFFPRLGGIGIDSGAPGSTSTNGGAEWRVRATTVEWLREVSNGQRSTPKAEVAIRAARLLSLYFREVVHTDPPSMKQALASLDRWSG